MMSFMEQNMNSCDVINVNNKYLVSFFKKIGHPRRLFRYFSYFHTNITMLQHTNVNSFNPVWRLDPMISWSRVVFHNHLTRAPSRLHCKFTLWPSSNKPCKHVSIFILFCALEKPEIYSTKMIWVNAKVSTNSVTRLPDGLLNFGH